MLQSMRSSAKYIFWFIAIAFIGGFLLVDTSGLLGRAPVSTGTTVAEVNGEDITYAQWTAATESLVRQEEARAGRALTLDERQRVENEAFEQLVNDVLVAQELERRGIRVTDDEIRQAAQTSPPPEFMEAPDLQTEGRFDPAKYQRFLASPAARQQGVLLALEQYYRREIPRLKLFDRIASDVYLTDGRLWRIYQDQNDSAQVSYVAFSADSVADSVVTVSNDEIRTYFDAHRDEFQRQGRAVVSLVTVPRVLTGADTAASRARAEQLRQEIASGAAFEDVARRVSADSGSAAEGGALGRGTLDELSFVEPFETAAASLAAGEVSQPVATQFGYHLIKVDARQGDTLTLRHILVPIEQSDSSATRTDRIADDLAEAAANSDRPAAFDSAARTLGLTVRQEVVSEGDVLISNDRYVPDVSAWAFSGVQPGETSDLITGDDGYYVARIDSLTLGGAQPLEAVREDIRRVLAREKKVAERLMPVATELARQAAGSTLESAAQGRGYVVDRTPMFARVGGAPGLGVANRAIGAAFGLPVGAVSQAVPTLESAVVLRVDRRVQADSSAWASQKEVQRAQLTQQLRQQRVQQFLASLRRDAKVEDRRAEVRTAGREFEATAPGF